MVARSGLSVTRRALLLGASAAAGLALSGAARRFGLWSPRPYDELDHAHCLELLVASLSDGQRKLLCFPWDHPSRQVTNTGTIFTRAHIGALLTAEQRELTQALVRGMLSVPGQRTLERTLAVDAGGLDACNLAIYGGPRERGFQASISGGHLHIRTPDASASGVAFGGAIAYGHQRGNKQFKVRGNAFAFQGDLANRVYRQLTEPQRARARVADETVEYVLQTQTRAGGFVGLPVREMTEAQQAEVKALLDGIFATYPERAQSEAWSCIENNGGLAALHVAFFEAKGFYSDAKNFAELTHVEQSAREAPYFQVWRVEGPGTVIHFKGHPHVHAYVNVVRDPARENVGEALARLDAPLAGDALRRWLETALARQTGAAVGYSGDEVAGRICPGEVTTGALWSLDPFDNRVVIATLRGEAMSAGLRTGIERHGIRVQPGQRYRVATFDFFASFARDLGTAERVERTDMTMRDLLVVHVRKHGLVVT